jgi:hypothetical protein
MSDIIEAPPDELVDNQSDEGCILELSAPLLGPAFHHNFGFGVELDTVPALGVQVTEGRCQVNFGTSQ